MKKIIAIIICVIVILGFETKGQNYSIVGDGTTSNTYTAYPAPFGNYYQGARHQFLVLATELTAAGIFSGSSISSVGFNVTNTNTSYPDTSFQVKVYTTSLSNPIGSGWLSTGLAASSTSTSILFSVGWQQLNLTTPFVWDGTSNLVIETCFNNQGTYSNVSTQWKTNLSGATYSRWYRTTAADACTNGGTTSTSTTTRPNIRFGYTICTPPSAPTAVTASPLTICNGSSTNLNATSAGNTIYWYTASTGGTYIGNSPSGSNFSVSPTSTTTYYAEAQKVAGCVSASRTSVTVTVNPTASVASVTGTSVLCAGLTTTYSATGVVLGGGSGVWTSSNTGIATVNSSTGLVTAVSAGTCNIIYTITGGCGGTPTAQIGIVVSPASVGGTLSGGVSPTCINMTTGQMSLSGQTGTVVKWQKQVNAGGWTDIVNTATTLNDIPTISGTTDYRVVIQNGSCATVYSSTRTITVTALPVATFNYSGTPYCSNGTDPSPTFTGGGVAGTFSSTAGLVFISTATGRVDLSASTAGNYTVTNTIAASGGCSQVVSTTSITIVAATTATAANNSPVNTGSALTLTGGPGGMTSYAWSGPNSYSNNTQSPTVSSSATTAMTGSYTVTVTNANGCTSTATTNVTVNAWSCGYSLPITHTVMNNVAPVFKTVNYGTVTTNLTGSNKCWITQNLGSDNQASAATDASEPSAGWYWQFNKKQGYKYNGITRIPGSTWITAINENNDWLSPNDPCTIELGVGWRLPTNTEWKNVNSTGGWVNYTSAYNSVLNLHAAGYLLNSSGVLSNRGTTGNYWSSTQSGNTNGLALNFSAAFSLVNSNDKAYGFSVRCLKDSCLLPNTPGVITGSSTQCSGLTGQIYSIAAVSGATSYTWTVPTGWSVTAGIGTTSITVNTGTTGQNGNISVAASNACGTSTANYLAITVTLNPSATISYAGAPFCTSVSTPQAVTLTGTAGGTFAAAPAGLTINASTGAITPSISSAGTYTVAYTIAAYGGCSAVIASTSVTITHVPTATISYSGGPFCISSSPVNVTQTGTAGGTYTSSPAGLYINSSTGLITPNLSTGAAYTVTYTIAASGGCATVIAMAQVNIIPSPLIISDPSNSYVCENSQAHFNVSASGGGFSYQWQESEDGGNNWNNLTVSGAYSDVSSSTMTINPVSSSMNDFKYRAVVNGLCAPGVISGYANLTVYPAPVVTSNPDSSQICVNANTSFSIHATGHGTLNYQWQVSTNNGTSFNNLSNTGVYSFVSDSTMIISGGTLNMNGYLYRCEVSSSCLPADISTGAKLTVLASPVISQQPISHVVCLNSSANFSVAASGAGLTYRWQLSTNGGATYNNLSNSGIYTDVTTNMVTINPVTLGMNTYLYRVVITGTCAPSIISDPASFLSVNTIPSSPTSISGLSTQCSDLTGQIYSITAVSGATSYFWIVPAGWAITSGQGTMAVTVTTGPAGQNGNICVTAGNSCGISTANCLAITVNASFNVNLYVFASENPVCHGITDTFTALPTNGGTAPVYQWKLNGSIVGTNSVTYTNTALANGDNITCTMTSDLNCSVGSPVTSNNIIMIVHPLPVLSINGLGLVYCLNSSLVTISGSPAGGTFSGSGIVGSTFSPLLAGTGNWEIKYDYEDANGCHNSDTVTVFVNNDLTPGTVASDQTICNNTSPAPFTNVTLPAGGNGPGTYIYQWQYQIGCVGVWTNILGATSATFDESGNLIQTTCYRRGAASGFCGTLYTNTITVTVNGGLTGGTIGNNQSICYNTSPGTFVNIQLPNGVSGPYTYHWQQQANCSGAWSYITGATSSTYHYLSNLTQLTCFRREVSVSCDLAYSDTISVSMLSQSNVSLNGLVGSYCISQTPVILSGMPAGGSFSGPGVSGNTFTPSIAGNGIWDIIYSFVNLNGCILSDTVTVIVNPVYHYEQNSTICSNNVMMWHGNNYSVTGTYYDSLQTVSGCDSVYVLHLVAITELPVSVSIEASPPGAICVGTNVIFTATPVNGGTLTIYHWKVNGNSVGTNNTTYSSNTLTNNDVVSCEMTSNAAPCATGSPATSNSITMIVHPLPVVAINGLSPFYCVNNPPVTLSGSPLGGSFSGAGLINGNTFSPFVAGTGIRDIVYAFIDVNGCINSDTVALMINPTYEFVLNDEICNNHIFSWRGNVYSIGGTYYDSLQTTFGCDSVYILNLGTNNLDVSVTQNGYILTANTTGAAYQWVNCDNAYAIIIGKTNQSFTATSVGNYAVIVTQGSCSDTSACIQITTVDIASVEDEEISVYPNPAFDELIIEKKNNSNSINFEIFNALGQIVFKGNMRDKAIVQTKNFTPGVYIIKLESGNILDYKKIIKE